MTSRGEHAVQAILASASGAEAEYAAAFGARPGHVPMDLWEGDRPRPTPETGAATPAPATAACRMRTIDPSPRSNTHEMAKRGHLPDRRIERRRPASQWRQYTCTPGENP